MSNGTQDAPETKSLEMRLAAIEDKLARMSVTEEEMRAYHKVSSLMASAAGPTTPPTALSPQVCQIAHVHVFPGTVHPQNVTPQNIINQIIRPGPIVADCIQAGQVVPQTGVAGFGTLGK
jgi:hypothetical protein